MALFETLHKYSKLNPKCSINVFTFESPIGNIIAAADDNFLYLVTFDDTKKIENRLHFLSKELLCDFIMDENTKILQQFKTELLKYFSGELTNFTVPIKTFGSEFQKEVWIKLQQLPYASTQTYGALALSMGRQTSHARAVGSACGANSHLLVVPCHRLVASGSKGGFSSGIDRKEWLLQHEQKYGN